MSILEFWIGRNWRTQKLVGLFRAGHGNSYFIHTWSTAQKQVAILTCMYSYIIYNIYIYTYNHINIYCKLGFQTPPGKSRFSSGSPDFFQATMLVASGMAGGAPQYISPIRDTILMRFASSQHLMTFSHHNFGWKPNKNRKKNSALKNH